MEVGLLFVVPFALIALGMLAVLAFGVVMVWRFVRGSASRRWQLPDDRDVRVLWQRWGLTFQPQGEVAVQHAASFLADQGSHAGAEKLGLPAGHGVRLVASGVHAGRSFSVADVFDVLLPEDRDTRRDGVPIVRVRALAVMPTPTTAGPLVVGRESALTTVASSAGLRDVELESGEFNRVFRVKGERGLAYAVLTPRVMQVLLDADAAGESVLLQVRDGLLCVYEVGVGGLAPGGQAVSGDRVLRSFTAIVEGSSPDTWPATQGTVEPRPVPVDARPPGSSPVGRTGPFVGLSPGKLALIVGGVMLVMMLPILTIWFAVFRGFIGFFRAWF